MTPKSARRIRELTSDGSHTPQLEGTSPFLHTITTCILRKVYRSQSQHVYVGNNIIAKRQPGNRGGSERQTLSRRLEPVLGILTSAEIWSNSSFEPKSSCRFRAFFLCNRNSRSTSLALSWVESRRTQFFCQIPVHRLLKNLWWHFQSIPHRRCTLWESERPFRQTGVGVGLSSLRSARSIIWFCLVESSKPTGFFKRKEESSGTNRVSKSVRILVSAIPLLEAKFSQSSGEFQYLGKWSSRISSRRKIFIYKHKPGARFPSIIGMASVVIPLFSSYDLGILVFLTIRLWLIMI